MDPIRHVGKLYVVATPIGNLSDISDRVRQVLSQVAWVAAEDTRHSAGLLRFLGVSPLLLSYHEHNEESRIASLIERLKQGEEGALISDAGTPLISDPGYGLVLRAHEANIPVVPLPGACAPIVALSASGLPTDKFLFEGFLPAKSGARIKRLEALKTFAHTILILEAPHRIRDCVVDMGAVFGEKRRVCIARELTKKFESIVLLPLKEILDAIETGRIPQKGEFVVIVEGARENLEEENEEVSEAQRVLSILLSEVSLKQAVTLAVKLTGWPKNRLYTIATTLKGGD